MSKKILFVVCSHTKEKLEKIIQINKIDNIFVYAYDSCSFSQQDYWNDLEDFLKGNNFDEIYMYSGSIKSNNKIPTTLKKYNIKRHGCCELFLGSSLNKYYSSREYTIIADCCLDHCYTELEEGTTKKSDLKKEIDKSKANKLLCIKTNDNGETFTQLKAISKIIKKPYEVLNISADRINDGILKTLSSIEKVTSRSNSITRKKEELKTDFELISQLLSRFPQTTTENNAIKGIIDFFHTICYAENIFYLSNNPAKDNILYSAKKIDQVTSTRVKKLLISRLDSNTPPIGTKNFFFKLKSDDEILGILYINRVAFSEYKKGYVSIIKTLINICTLIISNSRKYTELDIMHKKLTHVNQKLIEISQIDPLTKVANHRLFYNHLDKELRLALRNNSNLSVIMCDVDFFKQYNDTYGHLEGDKCLQAIATTLKDELKRPSDLVGRYGGEEFILILPDTDSGGARYIADLIAHNLNTKEIPHSSSSVSDIVTLSMGICTIQPSKIHNANEIINVADKALYAAKDEGRNRIIQYQYND